MSRHRPKFILPAAAAVLVGGVLAMAPLHGQPQWHLHHLAQSQQAPSQPRETSLEEAVAKVRQAVAGRILSAETVLDNGNTVHRIKVLTPQGRVITVEVDARSGELIE